MVSLMERFMLQAKMDHWRLNTDKRKAKTKIQKTTEWLDNVAAVPLILKQTVDVDPEYVHFPHTPILSP